MQLYLAICKGQKQTFYSNSRLYSKRLAEQQTWRTVYQTKAAEHWAAPQVQANSRLPKDSPENEIPSGTIKGVEPSAKHDYTQQIHQDLWYPWQDK